jgi:hypothetical protein
MDFGVKNKNISLNPLLFPVAAFQSRYEIYKKKNRFFVEKCRTYLEKGEKSVFRGRPLKALEQMKGDTSPSREA